MEIKIKQRKRIELMKFKLFNWGKWQDSIRFANLNYAKVVQLPAGVQEYNHDEAQEVEEIMVHMRRELPLSYKVLKQIYIYKETERDGASWLGITRREFQDAAREGRSFVLTYYAMIKNVEKFKSIA